MADQCDGSGLEKIDTGAIRGSTTTMGYSPDGPAPDDGRLSNALIDALRSEAQAVFGELGMELVSDERSGLTAYLPRSILTETDEDEDGRRYFSADGELEFWPVGLGRDIELKDLERAMLAGPGRRSPTIPAATTGWLSRVDGTITPSTRCSATKRA